MDTNAYRYEFPPGVPIDEVEDTLMLSALAVECLHGRTQLRLDGAFRLDKEGHSCVVDGRSDVGRSIARIFTGFLTREFGEDGFKVRKVAGETADDAEAVAAGGAR